MPSEKGEVIDIHAHVGVPEFYEEAEPHGVLTGFGAGNARKLGRGSIQQVTTD